MVYYCYLDDSKDQNQRLMVVSAGFFATLQTWGQLRTAWAKCLADNKIQYFKTSEYKMLEGQFARFKSADYPPPTGRQAASLIRDELLQIVRHIPAIRGVGMAIPLEDYARITARPESDGVLAGVPYPHAFGALMHATVNAVRRLPGRNMVAFVHDDGPDSAQLAEYYKGFKTANPKTAKFVAGFQSLNDKDQPPLQMADMVANFTLGIGLEWLDSGRTPDKLKEMQENIHFLNTWNEHYMLSLLKRELMRLGRPIPADLQADEYG